MLPKIIHYCWLGFNKKMMDAYNYYEYPSGTNVVRDTKKLENELPSWQKSDKNQLLEYENKKVLIIGLKDCNKYTKHLYTYTWADEKTKKKRIDDIKNHSNETRKSKIIWKIKTIMRNPRIINFFDKKRGSKFEKIYTFLAYDFLDYGPFHYIKLIFSKIKKRLKS